MHPDILQIIHEYFLNKTPDDKYLFLNWICVKSFDSLTPYLKSGVPYLIKYYLVIFSFTYILYMVKLLDYWHCKKELCLKYIIFFTTVATYSLIWLSYDFSYMYLCTKKFSAASKFAQLLCNSTEIYSIKESIW